MMPLTPLFRLILVAGLLAGCGDQPFFMKAKPEPAAADPAAGAEPEPVAVAVALPELAAPPPPVGAKTASALDTTTQAQKAAATAKPEPAGETLIGTTIVTLGNPTDPGFWLRGGPIKVTGAGRVETASGQSVQVELAPAEGAAQLSLPAFRALNLNLTDLPEVKVFAR
jgi:hypothetical protein